MEVTKLPDIIYHIQLTISERDLVKMEAYVVSGPAYTGYHEFCDLVKLIRKAVTPAENSSEKGVKNETR